MTLTDTVPSTSTLMTANTEMTSANHWDHFLARMGIRRGEHRVSPGLYKVGSPTADSSVFVTANYSLSFDALRTVLRGMDAYILVLDTRGVNVWCAAGKKTFRHWRTGATDRSRGTGKSCQPPPDHPATVGSSRVLKRTGSNRKPVLRLSTVQCGRKTCRST